MSAFLLSPLRLPDPALRCPVPHSTTKTARVADPLTTICLFFSFFFQIISPETARLRGTILGVPGRGAAIPPTRPDVCDLLTRLLLWAVAGDIVQRGSYLAQTLELEPEQLSLTEAAQDWRDLPEMQAREQQVPPDMSRTHTQRCSRHGPEKTPSVAPDSSVLSWAVRQRAH